MELLSLNKANALDHKPVFQLIDPSHFDGVVLGDFVTNIDTDFAGFAPVHRDIGRLVLFTVVDTVGFRTVGRTEMAIGFSANLFIYISNVIHDFSNKYSLDSSSFFSLFSVGIRVEAPFVIDRVLVSRFNGIHIRFKQFLLFGKFLFNNAVESGGST